MLIIYAIFYHLLDYYTVKIVNMQAEKGEKRAEVQKVKWMFLNSIMVTITLKN